MAAPSPKRPESDYWKEFEGIPLCHVATTPAEVEALKKKGVCGPQC